MKCRLVEADTIVIFGGQKTPIFTMGAAMPAITDAVVAAHILNSILVVPKLDTKSFWKDDSEEFIKKFPQIRGQLWTPYTMRVPRKCSERCYINCLLPVLLKKHAIQLTKFDYRVSNRLETDLQKLRCRVNYHALKFTSPILEMDVKLVHRMRNKSKHFIALHLRFEPDMLAFSGCDYVEGNKERRELGKIRYRIGIQTEKEGKEDALLLLRKFV